MGREVRRVPKDWQHPTEKFGGDFVPLHDGSFAKAAAEWDEENAKWSEGLCRDYSKKGLAFKPKGSDDTGSYEDYAGARPLATDYMPDWSEEEKTHITMYETCTEGTPLSPPMPDAESLARYLADTGASAFGSSTATYEQWLKMIGTGWAPSAVFSANTGLISGVAAS